MRRSGIEPTAISEVAYKIIRVDLQAGCELYRILVAGGGPVRLGLPPFRHDLAVAIRPDGP